jgi:hypothetical protein
MVQMSEEGLAKSYRPLEALFTAPHRFALVGGAAAGQMFFQATPDGLEQLAAIIDEKAEVQPRIVEDPKSGEPVERVSLYRSEVGAIDEIRIPTAADRLTFATTEAVNWLDQDNVIGGYIVELFRPDPGVTPDAVRALSARFNEKLARFDGLVALPFGSRDLDSLSTLTLSVDLRREGRPVIELPLLQQEKRELEFQGRPSLRLAAPDRSPARHQALLDVLAREALVRRIELPLRLQASPTASSSTGAQAVLPEPVPGETYPIVGVLDSGIGRNSQLDPWRAGTADLLPPADRDEGHGSFIAGLLAGAGALNPTIAGSLEPIPSRFYDIDILPRRGQLRAHYQTPDEFFDQLDAQVAVAKADGVRIFNMSLGAPGLRQG